jgi:hypothetical protein
VTRPNYKQSLVVGLVEVVAVSMIVVEVAIHAAMIITAVVAVEDIVVRDMEVTAMKIEDMTIADTETVANTDDLLVRTDMVVVVVETIDMEGTAVEEALLEVAVIIAMTTAVMAQDMSSHPLVRPPEMPHTEVVAMATMSDTPVEAF